MQTQTSAGVVEMGRFQPGSFPEPGNLLRVDALRKSFHSGTQEIAPLDGIDLVKFRYRKSWG